MCAMSFAMFFGVLSGGSLSASVEEVKACQLLSVQWLDAEAAIEQDTQMIPTFQAQPHGSVRYRAFHIQMKIQNFLK